MTFLLPMSVAISPALPGMATALGVADARIGLVITAITLPPMLLAPVVGVAGDMLGRRAVAIPGLFLYGAAGIAIGFVDSFALVLGLRGLQGVAMAGIGPLTVTILGDLYDGSVGTTAQGIRMSAAGTALVVIPVLVGSLAALAWQYPFFLYGISFLTMAAVYVFVPETAPERADLSVVATLRNYVRSIGAEVADRRLLVVMVGGFVRFYAAFGYFTYVPIFAVRGLGASAFVAGLVVAMSGVRILISPTAGWWVSQLSRRWALIATVTIQIVVFALIPFVPNVWWLAGLAVLFGFGDAIFDPVVNDGVTARVAARNRNGVVGGLRVLKEAGKTAGPAVLGAMLAVSGYTALFLSVTAVLGAYAVLVAVVLR
jgi:MFS family permease